MKSLIINRSSPELWGDDASEEWWETPPDSGAGTLSNGRRANVVRQRTEREVRLPSSSSSESGSSDLMSEILYPIKCGEGDCLLTKGVANDGFAGGMRAPKYADGGALPPPDKGPDSDLNPNTHKLALYFATDVPTLGQSVENFTAILTGGVGNVGLAAGLKLSSIFGIFTGALTWIVATEQEKKAREIGDSQGVMLSRLTEVRAVAEISSAVNSGALRAFTIASLYTTARVVVTGAEMLGNISTGVGSAFYLLLALCPAINAVSQWNFWSELSTLNGKNPLSSLGFLMDQLKLTDEEREAAVDVVSPDIRAMLSEEVELTDAEAARLTETDKAFVEKKTKETMLGVEESFYSFAVESHVRVRLSKELARMIEVKEAALERVTGKETIAHLKAKIKTPLIEMTEAEMKEIVDIAFSENASAFRLNVFVVITCIIGVVGFVLATVFTGGLPLLIALAIIVLSNTMMFSVDLYCFIQAVKDLQSTPKDRVIILICSALSILFTAAGSLIAGSALSRLIIIMLGVLFAGFQVGVLGWTWYNSEDKSRA